MPQQRGMKRARKVLERKQSKAKITKKANIKQAIYTYEKAVKAAEAGHDHAGHDHAGHDHSSHEGHDHG